jgi:translation elongation factor EF-4
MDLVNLEEASEKCKQLGILNESNNNTVMISSKTGMNVSVLLETIQSKIFVNDEGR